jgi:hypothetical protein
MTLARTLILSNLSISEEEMEIELQKFDHLDLFCIVKREDVTESYPIVDINPRTWKQAIVSSPNSSIINSLENIFIAVMKQNDTWHLNNILIPPTTELENLQINLLKADKLNSFICLTKTPNYETTLNSWMEICHNFKDGFGDDQVVTFPRTSEKEAGFAMAESNLTDHQMQLLTARAVLSPTGSLDPTVFGQAQTPVGALFQSVTPGSIGTPSNLLGQPAPGTSGPDTGSLPFIQTLSFLALSNQQKQYLTENKQPRSLNELQRVLKKLSQRTKVTQPNSHERSNCAKTPAGTHT